MPATDIAPGPETPLVKVSPAGSGPGPEWLAGLRQSRVAAPTVLLVIMVVGIAVKDSSVLTTTGIGLLLESGVPLIFAAMAQMFVILGEGFDVGLGYSVGLANVITATILVHHPALGLLALLGLVGAYVLMAVIVEIAGVPGIVVALGGSFIWLGLGLIIQSVPGGTAPGWLSIAFDGDTPFIAEPAYLTVILAIVGWLVLRRTKWGATLRAFGGSPASYRQSGRSTLAARMSLYGLAGLCVALSGAMTTVVFSGSDISASQTLTLASVVAVIVGGGQFIGGVVEPIGLVVAAVALTLIPTLLGAFNVSTNYQPGVEGLILVIVIVARRLAQSKKEAEL